VTGPSACEPLTVTATQVAKLYGRVPALRNVSCTVAPGKLLAVLGPNGAGKTTLLSILATLMRPSSGSVRYGGLESDPGALRGAIGLLSHKTLLYEELSGLENLVLFARLYDVADAGARAAELLELVGLSEQGSRLVRAYSRGMQQRLAAARALIARPRLLLMDEPFTGLDQSGAAMLRELLARETERGTTIVLVTHDLELAAGLARHTLILNRGSVAFEGERALDPQELREVYHKATGTLRRDAAIGVAR